MKRARLQSFPEKYEFSKIPKFYTQKIGLFFVPKKPCGSMQRMAVKFAKNKLKKFAILLLGLKNINKNTVYIQPFPASLIVILKKGCCIR